MAFDAPAQPTMAECPLFQAHRAAEFERLQAKALAETEADDGAEHRAFMREAAERDELLDRLGLSGLQNDRTPITVWSGR